MLGITLEKFHPPELTIRSKVPLVLPSDTLSHALFSTCLNVLIHSKDTVTVIMGYRHKFKVAVGGGSWSESLLPCGQTPINQFTNQPIHQQVLTAS